LRASRRRRGDQVANVRFELSHTECGLQAQPGARLGA